jgi:phospholipid/cholesterol/gamma-HCH transport system substrate-binding protein
VFIKGYKAGKVTEVEYHPGTGSFTVVCSIQNEFYVPVDSKMTIYATDIMGSKGVKIDLGESDSYAGDGSFISADIEAGLVDGLAAQITPLVDKVTTTLDSLTVTVAGVNRLLGEENQRHIANTLADLEKTVESVKVVAEAVEGRSGEIEEFITGLLALSDELSVIAEKAAVTIDGVNETVGVVTERLSEADLAGLIESFKSILEKMNDPDGTIGKLLYDGSVYNSLDELLIDIDSLVKKIQENPKKYMKLSIF